MNTSIKNKGSITIFVALLIPVIVAFFFTMIDFTRIVGARNQVNMAANNAIESALGNYDSDLYGSYGLLAFKGNEEMKSDIRTVVRKNLYVDDQYSKSFYGFQITDNDIDVDFRGNLFQRDVLEEQMIRAMKYQAPTNLVLGALTKFTELGKVNKKAEAADDLEKLNKEVEKFDKKLDDIDDAKKALMELGLDIFKNYAYLDDIPYYANTITNVEWTNLAEASKNFIYQCAVYGGQAFDLRDINITNAFTIKYMEYIIKAYEKFPLPEVTETEDDNSNQNDENSDEDDEDSDNEDSDEDSDDSEEPREKIDDILDSRLANELDSWCDDLIDSFEDSLDFDGIKSRLNKGLLAIQYIKENKGSLDDKIAQYENEYLTQENLSGTDGTYYQNIKKDIDQIKSKLGALNLEEMAICFTNGESVIDLVLSNVATYSSGMDQIENTISESSINQSEFDEIESYFSGIKSSIGLGTDDSISNAQYREIAKKMVKGLNANSTLSNSLPSQLSSLKNLAGAVNDNGIDGIVFTVDPVTLATEGAKNFWNYFKKAILKSDSLISVISNLPESNSIDADIIASMPGNIQDGLVPADMTVDEFSESVKNNGIFDTNNDLAQDKSMFQKIAQLVGDTGNELFDQFYLVEYIMTYYKTMVDTETRMPIEYDGNTVLENEVEAIVNNCSYSDGTNKAITVSELATMRTVLNFIALRNNNDVMVILDSIAAAIPFGIGVGVKYAILIGWTLLETRYDLLDLLRGYSVPIIKSPNEWVSKLYIDCSVITSSDEWDDSMIETVTADVDVLVQYPEDRNTPYNNQENSSIKLDYTDMCRILLLLSSKDKLVTRSGNLTYANLKDQDRTFDCREYFVGIKTSVGSDIKKWFNAETFVPTGDNGGFKIRKIEVDKGYD